jgi:uncharacterized membrane protein
MKKCLYAIIAFSVALAIRLYPTFLSGLPFSTDAWSPIRNTELLLERTPISLDNAVMDGYNCYWPANSLFGAVFSQATGLKPMAAMAFGIPLAGALTIPIFYALIYRISGSRRLAFFSSILLATAYPYALFTAGVTKETYANPLYVLSILIFMSRGKWRKTLLFAVAFSALVMAHHLTALVAIAVLATIALASSIVRVRRRAHVSPDGSSFLLVSILTAATALYFARAQEEATHPKICKPVLVLRTSTERPEAVIYDFAKIVGINPVVVLAKLEKLLGEEAKLPNKSPFGDGKAATRIVDIITSRL